jgi:hypothetical protein
VNALTLTLFASGGIVSLMLVAFFAAWRRKDHEHADRLSLLPLDEDTQ